MVARPYSVSVSTTPVRIVDYDPYRKSVNIFNNGTSTVYLGVDRGVNATEGMPLGGSNGLIFSEAFGDDPRLERWGVTSSGSSDVRVSTEVRIEKKTTVEETKKS